MCGIVGITGRGWSEPQLSSMLQQLAHRGPDARGTYEDPDGLAALGHARLSVIDLTDAGRQPMACADGRYWIAFNGEIYNYLELRAELSRYTFRTRTDTEVILAAYERWGEACLRRFIGMFALLIWDARDKRLLAARDRFGVKPLYYAHRPDGGLVLASEIKAARAGGLRLEPDQETWASYLAEGVSDSTERTFWCPVKQVPPGHQLVWQSGHTRVTCWYDLAERVGQELDERPWPVALDEYRWLLQDSIRLRFRSDVPVGINLSGGLDSSTLLGLVQLVQGSESDVKAFTFVTGDPRYDELPWVRQMLERTWHPHVVCELRADEVPRLAVEIQGCQEEPFGGIPTIAYSRIFQRARSEGVIVLLDGQGMDEQWAGYDYYDSVGDGGARPVPVVQGSTGRALRPECLVPEFRELASPVTAAGDFTDRVRQLQYRDLCHTKIPRALRYNDRVSMMHSVELREPFLDHRLVELALRQPADRKLRDGTRKWMLRQIAARLLPEGVVEAPKRPVQTPQREWLRGPLREWAEGLIEAALAGVAESWLDAREVRDSWREYVAGRSDNSFYVWQWISLGMMLP